MRFNYSIYIHTLLYCLLLCAANCCATASVHLTPATVAVGCVEEESWAKATKVLVDRDIPCCFTSMTAAEADLDAAALRAAGAHISHSGRNTWASTIPLRDMDSAPDEFYFTNGFAMLFQGRKKAEQA